MRDMRGARCGIARCTALAPALNDADVASPADANVRRTALVARLAVDVTPAMAESRQAPARCEAAARFVLKLRAADGFWLRLGVAPGWRGTGRVAPDAWFARMRNAASSAACVAERGRLATFGRRWRVFWARLFWRLPTRCATPAALVACWRRARKRIDRVRFELPISLPYFISLARKASLACIRDSGGASQSSTLREDALAQFHLLTTPN